MSTTDHTRPSTSVTRSHEGRAGNARDRTDRKVRKGEMGARDNEKERKQHPAHCLPLHNSSSTAATAQQQPGNSSRSITQNTIMKERIWFDRVASEIVFQPFHPITGASLHSERVIAVREEHSTSRSLPARCRR